MVYSLGAGGDIRLNKKFILKQNILEKEKKL